MEKLSPMMQQYQEIKRVHQDYILFYRLGDFYEMFFDDAILASRELELTLTGRDCGLPERAPMCGVPYHACDAYVKKLVEKGYKVAICEQVESPYQAKGVVKREVIRITTPGTIIESSMLPEGENNFLGSLYLAEDGFGICFADISTGEVQFSQRLGKELEHDIIDALSRFSPVELLCNNRFFDCREAERFMKQKLHCTVDPMGDEAYKEADCAARITGQFGKSLRELDLSDRPYAQLAVGVLLQYLQQTQKAGVERLTNLSCYDEEKILLLDYTARSNLELTETIRTREKRGSLLWVLDKTRTAMGKRLLRKDLEQPLASAPAILRRQNAVGELVRRTMERGDLMEALGNVYDLQRLMTKVVYGTVNPRELLALATTACHLPGIKQILEGFESPLLRELWERMDVLDGIRDLIERAIDPECPITLKDGGVIREGFDAQLDELTGLRKNARGYLTAIEERERERTGIRNLKIGYNRVFGYYIEVTKSNLDQVPEDYIRKQTLVGGERFITPELKELETKVLYATEKQVALEMQLYDQVRGQVRAQQEAIERTAAVCARLDVLCSLAQAAAENGYVCPTITLGGGIQIIGGRHPVVEAINRESPFIPNDTLLDTGKNRMAVITGPNMAGKSTYMRQVALIVIMAQMGSFVPADSADIGLVDRIFTRVGASDDLAAGQSTFMVEMTEVANILQNATPNSLVILDEIGRGTSTFDGMSIARAVVEYLVAEKNLGCKTLFATHYHELTEMENQYEGVVNYSIAVRKKGDDIIFLRKIVRGGADDSYGIEVAKLAGLPQKVIRRAHTILEGLEAQTARPVEQKAPEVQVSLADQAGEKVLKQLRQLDLDSLTPRDALDTLYELRQML